MVKQAERKRVTRLRDVAQKRKEVREPEFRKWCQATGFEGVYKVSGASFVAHELGISADFVRSVMAGRENFSFDTAMAMRTIARTKAKPGWKDIDYDCFTAKVDEKPKVLKAARKVPRTADNPGVITVPPAPAPSGNDATETSPGPPANDPMAGMPRKKDANYVLITTEDGQRHLVELPKGAKPDGQPIIVRGKGGESGSVQLIFIKKKKDTPKT